MCKQHHRNALIPFLNGLKNATYKHSLALVMQNLLSGHCQETDIANDTANAQCERTLKGNFTC